MSSTELTFNSTVKGDRNGIANALRELVTRIAEAPEKKNSSSPNGEGPSSPTLQPNRGPQGTYQIKVLIPKVASAAIIGKGGSVIKRMSEVSGARYQLGDEMDPYNTKERIVTITSLTVHNLVMVIDLANFMRCSYAYSTIFRAGSSNADEPTV